MSASPLTIRNVTSTPIELKLLERFEAAHHIGDVVGGISQSVGLKRNTTALPSSAQIALKSETFNRQDVAIPVRPFEIKTTDVQPKENEVLRLTFDIEGQKYRVDAPTPSQRSTVLASLSPDPRFELTAVYLPKYSYLALFSSAKLESWMSNFSEDTPLSGLSIPGTHNSPTYHKALPSVRCQAVGVGEQLNNGVRFLDIRVQPESPEDPANDGLILVHGVFPISLTGKKQFRDLVNQVFEFLDDHPSETVIVSLKREGVGKSTDQQLSKILHSHYATDPSRWFTENRIPTIGEARKKIVVIRRFDLDESLKREHNGTGWCIDASSWPDNCADGTCSSGDIRIQDFYEVVEAINIDKKISYITDELVRAEQAVCTLPGVMTAAVADAAKQQLFINFLSASNFWRPNCWPRKIAAKINPAVIEFLCRQHNGPKQAGVEAGQAVGDGSTGIVVCDWVGHHGDWDLIRCIVGMNAKLELREKTLS